MAGQAVYQDSVDVSPVFGTHPLLRIFIPLSIPQIDICADPFKGGMPPGDVVGDSFFERDLIVNRG